MFGARRSGRFHLFAFNQKLYSLFQNLLFSIEKWTDLIRKTVMHSHFKTPSERKKVHLVPKQMMLI